jgi:hypothetical protein
MDFGVFTMVSTMLLVHPRPLLLQHLHVSLTEAFWWPCFTQEMFKFRLGDPDLVNNSKFTTTWSGSGQPRLEVTWTKED